MPPARNGLAFCRKCLSGIQFNPEIDDWEGSPIHRDCEKPHAEKPGEKGEWKRIDEAIAMEKRI